MPRQRFSLLLKRGETLFRILKFWREKDFSLYIVLDIGAGTDAPHISYQTSGLAIYEGLPGLTHQRFEPLHSLTRSTPLIGAAISDFRRLRTLKPADITQNHIVLNTGAPDIVTFGLTVFPRGGVKIPPSGIGVNLGLASLWVHGMQFPDYRHAAPEIRFFGFRGEAVDGPLPPVVPAFVQAAKAGRDALAVFGPGRDGAYTLHPLGEMRGAPRVSMTFGDGAYVLRLDQRPPHTHRIPFKILGPKGFVKSADLAGVIESIALG